MSDVCHREIKLGITTSQIDYNSDNREIWFSDLQRVKSDVRQENRPSIEPQRELENRGCKKTAKIINKTPSIINKTFRIIIKTRQIVNKSSQIGNKTS